MTTLIRSASTSDTCARDLRQPRESISAPYTVADINLYLKASLKLQAKRKNNSWGCSTYRIRSLAAAYFVRGRAGASIGGITRPTRLPDANSTEAVTYRQALESNQSLFRAGANMLRHRSKRSRMPATADLPWGDILENKVINL